MREKKQYLLLPCFILILTCILSGFSSGRNQRDIYELLKHRTDIIQQVWYSDLTAEQGEKKLREIETHPLLKSDIAALRAFEEGTDFAYISEMEVKNLQKSSKSAFGTYYTSEIQWTLVENSTQNIESETYRICIKQQGKHLLLSEFSPL